MNISGKTKVFKNERNGKDVFSTSISNKKEDGTYDNMYVNVQFPKESQPADSCDVDIKKGFLSFYRDKDNNTHLKFVVLEYSVLEQTEAEFQVSTEDELPF